MTSKLPSDGELAVMARQYFAGRERHVSQTYISELIPELRGKLLALLRGNTDGVSQDAVSEAINHILMLRLANAEHEGNH